MTIYLSLTMDLLFFLTELKLYKFDPRKKQTSSVSALLSGDSILLRFKYKKEENTNSKYSEF